MQAQQLSSWTAPVLAFCLSLLLSVTLAPTLGLVAYQQYDFWLLWLICMLFLAFPFTLLEIALAKRAKATPLQAFMQLTRDADRSTHWRLIGWGALVFVPFIVGAMLEFSTQQIQTAFALEISSSLIVLGLAVVAFGLSMVPRVILLITTVLLSLVFAVVCVLQSTGGAWQWTSIELSEWAKVVTLTLVTGGLGLGLYWQSALHHAKAQSKLTSVALPIWAAQAVGLGCVIFVANIQSGLQAGLFLAATLSLSALLLQFIREQVLDRQLPLIIQALILLLPVLIWAIPQSHVVFYPLVIVYGLCLSLLYAIFVGWLMKISHLRKSLNFSNEMLYNVWRVFIRIVMPVSIIVALAGWVSMLVGA